MEQTIHPSGLQLEAFVQEYPENTAVVILNFLKFRSMIETGQTGSEAYDEYGEAAAPFLEAAGARILWRGNAKHMVIGPDNEIQWDEFVLIEYPDKNSFIEMIQKMDYPHPLRTRALEDSRIVACKPRTAFS